MLADNMRRRLFLGVYQEDDILAGRHKERVKKAKERFTSFGETRTEYEIENGNVIVKLFICDERKH